VGHAVHGQPAPEVMAVDEDDVRLGVRRHVTSAVVSQSLLNRLSSSATT
jgi:hypothetical protein